MLIKKLVIGLLSFYYVEVKNIPNAQSNIVAGEFLERIYEKKKKREKRQERTYDNRKWKKKKSYREKNFKLSGIHSKNVRYSNQRSLRRMYRNS